VNYAAPRKRWRSRLKITTTIAADCELRLAFVISAAFLSDECDEHKLSALSLFGGPDERCASRV
jgi:hypothetical protein